MTELKEYVINVNEWLFAYIMSYILNLWSVTYGLVVQSKFQILSCIYFGYLIKIVIYTYLSSFAESKVHFTHIYEYCIRTKMTIKSYFRGSKKFTSSNVQKVIENVTIRAKEIALTKL